MKHVKALSIKFLIVGVVIFSILSIFESATIMDMLSISLLVTGLAYVIGDLFILPRFGNAVATIADFGLVGLSVWTLSVMFIGTGPGWVPSFSASFFISLSEILFHAYMKEKIIVKEKRENNVVLFPANRRLQTEFAEENEIHPEKDKKE